MRSLSILVLCSLVAVVACGGDSPTGTDEPSELPPQTIVDFSSIAGTWVGTGVETIGVTFWIKARLNSRFRPGRKFGDIEYGPANSELGDGTDTHCVGEWFAGTVKTADPPQFTVSEVISPCPDGTVELEYDSENGTLSYHYVPESGNTDIEATAILTRP